MTSFIGSIDQGTSSTRFTVYSLSGEVIASHQTPVSRTTPFPDWVEQDPLEIINSVRICMNNVSKKLINLGYNPKDVLGIGITNQRETVIVWEKNTGRPLYNAVVWCDNRNAELVDNLAKKLGGINIFSEKTGLPLSPYFSATKLLWLRENIPEIQEAFNKETCLVGTIDTWVTWCLTGGNSFVTDVTNASRTFLLDIHKLEWDDELIKIFGIPKSSLPKVLSSAEIYGRVTDQYGSFEGCPISGIIGDQQASLVGNKCLRKGTAKITYGTGCFLLLNIGETPTFSKKGLITTIGYKLGRKAPVIYAIEGSVATCGFAVQWLGDILGKTESVHELASSVENSGGVYFVPAFSGLLCPYWKPDARGCFLGLTGYTSRGHIARSVIEGIAFQAMDVLDAADMTFSEVRVDGGLSRSDLLLQIQSDLLNLDVLRGSNVEATSKGAAIAATYGIGMMGAGIITGEEEFKTFRPNMSENIRNKKRNLWKKAVLRSFDWIDLENDEENL